MNASGARTIKVFLGAIVCYFSCFDITPSKSKAADRKDSRYLQKPFLGRHFFRFFIKMHGSSPVRVNSSPMARCGMSQPRKNENRENENPLRTLQGRHPQRSSLRGRSAARWLFLRQAATCNPRPLHTYRRDFKNVGWDSKTNPALNKRGVLSRESESSRRIFLGFEKNPRGCARTPNFTFQNRESGRMPRGG